MRYFPHTAEEIQSMLKTIGVNKLEDLFQSIPENVRLKDLLPLPKALAESELREQVSGLANKNISLSEAKNFIGAGAYYHYTPSAINYLLKRGEFLTCYTPYQPEVSQGTLQSVFEFQTMVCELTGMEVANASQYDLSTSCAEAILMANRVNQKTRVLISRSLHPHYRAVIATYLENLHLEILEIPFTESGQMDLEFVKKNCTDNTSSVLVQSPNFLGVIEDLKAIRAVVPSDCFLIAANPEAISYGVLATPGECGVDIAIAEGMSFGLGLNFGGPYLGLFATNQKHIRQMPGRLVGETVDTEGTRGYVLTMATREQHIRREKATSNICTNQGLMALAASIYLSLLGPKGLENLALINMERQQFLTKQLQKANPKAVVFNGPRFNETIVKLKVPVMDAVVPLLKQGIFPGIDLGTYYPELERHLLVCTTEMNSKEDVQVLANRLAEFI